MLKLTLGESLQDVCCVGGIPWHASQPCVAPRHAERSSHRMSTSNGTSPQPVGPPGTSRPRRSSSSAGEGPSPGVGAKRTANEHADLPALGDADQAGRKRNVGWKQQQHQDSSAEAAAALQQQQQENVALQVLTLVPLRHPSTSCMSSSRGSLPASGFCHPVITKFYTFCVFKSQRRSSHDSSHP